MRHPNTIMMLSFATLVGFACGDSWLTPRRDHCAVQEGDSWCASQHPDGSRPFCRRGFCGGDGLEDATALDGCVAEHPEDQGCYSPCGDETSAHEDMSCLDPGRVPAEPDPSDDSGEEPSDDDDDPADALCGNGIIEADELCDDGDSNGSPGACPWDCRDDVPTRCGDGELQPGEACDDGNSVDGDGCNTDCRESGTVVWERLLARDGRAHGVDVGLDGSIYVAGELTAPTTAAWAARLTPSGTLVWTEVGETPIGAGDPDLLADVRVMDDGTAAFVGRHDDAGWFLRMDATGSVQESYSETTSFTWHNVEPLRGGDYLVKRDSHVARLNSAFAVQWESVPGLDLAYRPESSMGLTARTNAGFIRFSSSGVTYEPVFVAGLDAYSIETRHVTWTSDGDVVIAGRVSQGGVQEMLVVRSSIDGEIRWIHGPDSLMDQERRANCIATDSDDNILAGGYGFLLGDAVPYVIKLSPNGEVLWRTYPAPDSSYGRIWGCAVTPSNELVVVGESNYDLWAAKLTP